MTSHQAQHVTTVHQRTPEQAGAASASLLTRLVARLTADRLDRDIAVGVPAPPGSALAVHAARLTSRRERETIARALRQLLHDATATGPLMSSRIPLNVANIVAAADLIDRIALHLHSPRPVAPRGMARLRLILSDGRGPLYRYGRGDLRGRLGAALAEL
ncbi:Uncharacterised protein [Mycolicibacterium phlei]|jgi:hypothetical protein|uniref:Uncharacterized protein n=1 Tax=Mycolicibacterium phlei DSM 43239 = CCUG 21000 TaxID=1226750 RepID=A0A5N5USG8_MYCPH|nr:hypothetical protein [Mycolicibacterium phlei]VEG09314.1 Uncharacterised protein [Mycobacteroides chelonae]AMO61199.1 hypothetical protein MPHLCCUG_02386 [Mycolicibacterium phlei]KAB7752554.1 hypothetical protein MPHL21000_21560 [Mycolicibacterium phlei DSM 43239 = CCUG 21000]KXW60904.1 hypothetical protein MPHL43239_23335 [Mycolicibacterium phlei DSM 43239 = CCUG 21000]KXW62865.1 hypothetical protein MPHL43072_08005 [Mycolicibacterium phlei DSM 43072]